MSRDPHTYASIPTRPLYGTDMLHWSPDTSTPDTLAMVTSHTAIPPHIDDELWAIDSTIGARSPARRLTWLGRALAWVLYAIPPIVVVVMSFLLVRALLGGL